MDGPLGARHDVQLNGALVARLLARYPGGQPRLQRVLHQRPMARHNVQRLGHPALESVPVSGRARDAQPVTRHLGGAPRRSEAAGYPQACRGVIRLGHFPHSRMRRSGWHVATDGGSTQEGRAKLDQRADDRRMRIRRQARIGVRHRSRRLGLAAVARRSRQNRTAPIRERSVVQSGTSMEPAQTVHHPLRSVRSHANRPAVRTYWEDVRRSPHGGDRYPSRVGGKGYVLYFGRRIAAIERVQVMDRTLTGAARSGMQAENVEIVALSIGGEEKCAGWIKGQVAHWFVGVGNEVGNHAVDVLLQVDLSTAHSFEVDHSDDSRLRALLGRRRRYRTAPLARQKRLAELSKPFREALGGVDDRGRVRLNAFAFVAAAAAVDREQALLRVGKPA